MVDTRRTSYGAKGLAITVALLLALGTPARALAQTTKDGGASTWSFPDEPPAELPPKPQQKPAPKPEPAPPPSAEPVVPGPPAELPVPHPAEPPPPSGPRHSVTINPGETASVSIRGPGLKKPLHCSDTCTFDLWEDTYWLDIESSGRTWTMPVTVTEPQRVVVDAPNAGTRTLGIVVVVIGGSILSVAGFVLYVYALDCGGGSPYQGTAECRDAKRQAPYWLAAGGAGALISVLGIGLIVSNNKPSLEFQPLTGNRARRTPGTFVGLGSVEGSTLPGLTLRTSF